MIRIIEGDKSSICPPHPFVLHAGNLVEYLTGQDRKQLVLTATEDLEDLNH